MAFPDGSRWPVEGSTKWCWSRDGSRCAATAPSGVKHAHDDDSKLASKKVLIGGSVEANAEAGRSRHGDAYMCFVDATGQTVAVCSAVWERMLWEETNGGWVDEEVEAGSVAADGSVLLVGRFVVKRMDSSVVVAFDFMHHKTMRPEHV